MTIGKTIALTRWIFVGKVMSLLFNMLSRLDITLGLERSLEGLMLKLQYFDHLMRRADSLEKTLILGKIQGGRRRERQRMDGWIASPTWWTWIWVSSRRWWGTGKPAMMQPMELQKVRHYWVTEQQQSLGRPCSQCADGQGPASNKNKKYSPAHTHTNNIARDFWFQS